MNIFKLIQMLISNSEKPSKILKILQGSRRNSCSGLNNSLPNSNNIDDHILVNEKNTAHMPFKLK